jgi:hypothetical protein
MCSVPRKKCVFDTNRNYIIKRNKTLPGLVDAVVVVPVAAGPSVVVGVHKIFPFAGTQQVLGPPVKRRLWKKRGESVSAWKCIVQQMAREMYGSADGTGNATKLHKRTYTIQQREMETHDAPERSFRGDGRSGSRRYTLLPRQRRGGNPCSRASKKGRRKEEEKKMNCKINCHGVF